MPGADPRGQAQEVATEYQRLVVRGQSQRPDLCELQSRVQPGAVRTEQQLVSTRAPYGVRQQIEAAHTGAVGVDVRMTHEMVSQGHLSPPIVREASQVRQ